MKRSAWLCLLLFAACARAQAPKEETPAPAASKPVAAVRPAPTPPSLRLPESVLPLREAIDLRVVPTEDRFRGSVAIELELKSATDVVWLNATDLTIDKATIAVGSETRAAKPIVAAPDFVGFQVDHAV